MSSAQVEFIVSPSIEKRQGVDLGSTNFTRFKAINQQQRLSFNRESTVVTSLFMSKRSCGLGLLNGLPRSLEATSQQLRRL